ncbi:uncharacterized protein JCM6883_001776 [Sporobolomyces salmoneus]|uniref:uncharacterized protein n=1 Tax=Sporobolomyces salmoneus TaxID=183962 RepID=UPI00317B38D9
MTTIYSIPPELLIDILSQAMTLSLFTPPLLIHGQFSQLPTKCRTCCYRQFAGVCKTWNEIVREEFMGKEIVFGAQATEKDEEILSCVMENETKAGKVKKVDASLRGWQGWKSLPMINAATEIEGEEESNGFLQTREAQLEKQRQQILNRDRQRLVKLLSACRKIQDFDIDVGFYSSIPRLPTILPPTIRTLTLRNCNAQETFDLIENLPLLEDLTLRLALDWRISPSSPRPVPSCQLRRFELSFTAFASAKLDDVLTLLSSSMDTLTSLTIRNKGTSPEGLKSLLPISRGLVETFSPQLEQLAIKDIPRSGRRSSESRASSCWFPIRPTKFPRLRSLQLTGLPSITPNFFRSTILLPSGPTKLERLVVEDFDSPSPQSFFETLDKTSELQSLRLLEISIRQNGEGTVEAEKAIDEWCDGKGRTDGGRTELRASWRMKKIDHYCGFW